MRLCEIKIVGIAQKTVQGRATLWGETCCVCIKNTSVSPTSVKKGKESNGKWANPLNLQVTYASTNIHIQGYSALQEMKTAGQRSLPI